MEAKQIRPPSWPFPPLDPVQARNHQRAHEAVMRELQRRQAQKLSAAIAAMKEATV